ncbi:MAG TPA: hypothetical protein VFB69_08615 [Candidatus Dormibacteraeota bacterium]|nr:hypothetical protein [Candidatus Dormibacteraeota bacterium]
MRLKTVFVGGAVACGLSVAAPAVASANVMWCVGDPPVQMSSPSGTNFTVSTQIFTTGNKQHLSQLVDEKVTSVSDGHGGTLVTVEIIGPAGQPMTVVASVNKYKVSGQASGVGDVSVTLDVPVA